MKAINLLPRVTYVKRAFIPLLIIIISFNMICLSTFILLSISSDDQLQAKEAEISKLRIMIQDMEQIRVPDPLAVDYENFQKDIHALSEHRRDWKQLFNGIVNLLPEKARITSLTSASSQLTFQLQIVNPTQLAPFIQWLKKNPEFHAIHIENLARVDVPLSDFISVNQASQDPLTSAENAIKDQTGEDTTEEIEPPVDESDRLLQELEQLLNQEATRDQFGVELPAKEIPDVVGADEWLQDDLFTIEEIMEAQKKLETFKGTEKAAEEAENLVTYYNVALRLDLRPLSAGTEAAAQ